MRLKDELEVGILKCRQGMSHMTCNYTYDMMRTT